MPILHGKNISNNQQVFRALILLYGIGFHTARKACQYADINGLRKVSALSKQDLRKLSYSIQMNFKINDELKKQEFARFRFLYQSKTYRGLRHKMNLSVRGQKTSRNAKTQKHLKRSKLL